MSRLVRRLRREPTTPGIKTASQVFTSPGVYQPKYGKTKIYVSGRGESGNNITPGTVANYNAPTPGNYVSTNPSSGGNYAGTNPSTGGNYAGTYAPSGGNVAGYNPSTPPSYAGTNAPTLGNVAGYNPSSPGYTITTPGNYVAGNTNPGTTTPGNSVPENYQEVWTYYGPGGMGACPTGWAISGYDYDEFGKPHRVCELYTAAYTNPSNYTPGNTNADYTNPSTSYYQPAQAGNANYNPTVPGTDYYNPGTSGNAIYNPTTPGNAYYNPISPGNAVYNPVVGGNANYNPATPGNANYNSPTPGNAGRTYTTLGVTFPGGAAGSVAPQVGDTLVTLTYSNTGIPVEVRTGGTVTVKEQ